MCSSGVLGPTYNLHPSLLPQRLLPASRPAGIKPERLLAAFDWSDTLWRRGELCAQFEGKTVLMGIDDMDVFKGIELKLQAFEQVLIHHAEWRGRLVLVQVTSAARLAFCLLVGEGNGGRCGVYPQQVP